MTPSQGSAGAVGSGDQATHERTRLFKKLKPGPGLPAETVFADQRRRLRGAMLALISKSGPEKVKVRALAEAAGVSTATFYKHFANVDECLAATYDGVMDAAVNRSAIAGRAHSAWEESLRAAVAALMDSFAYDEDMARLALVDIFAAGPDARRRIGRAMAELEAVIVDSLSAAPRSVAAPRHLVAGMTAGLLQIARKTAMDGRADELPGLASEVAGWMLTLPHPEVRSLLSQVVALRKGSRREVDPLPAGSDSGAGFSYADERSRLLRATVKLATREGVTGLTGPKVRAAAGVTKKRFEEQFASVDECVLDAIETLVGDAALIAEDWSSQEESWERRTCRFVLASCAQAARNRQGARLAFVGIFAVGRTGLVRRQQLLSRIASTFQATVPAAQRPSQVVAEASVGAAWNIAQADILTGRASNLPTTAPLLSYVVLAPIVGPETAVAAVRETTAGRLQTAAWERNSSGDRLPITLPSKRLRVP